MSALDKVVALARPYERTEPGGHLERVRGYTRDAQRDASSTTNDLITTLAVKLQDHLDPAIFQRLVHGTDMLSAGEADRIVRMLDDYRQQLGIPWEPGAKPLPKGTSVSDYLRKAVADVRTQREAREAPERSAR